ncbi:hypothetical protein FXO38_08352 [Capsicum annuum]|nr:hypothetical protein FXO38_08352 [Capsicum annuum]
MTICRNHCNGLVFACIAIKTVNFIYTMSPQGRYKHCHRDYYRTNLSTLGFDQVTQNYKLLCFFSRPEEGKAKRAKLLTLGVTNSSWRKVRNWLKPDPCDIYRLRNVFSSMGLFIGPVVLSVAPTSTSARRSLGPRCLRFASSFDGNNNNNIGPRTKLTFVSSFVENIIPLTSLLMKDSPSPLNLKKQKIDRIESQRKRKSMLESPSSSHRMTQSQSQRLLGACKDEEKDLSKGKDKVGECIFVSAKKKKRNEIEKNGKDTGASSKKKRKVSDQLSKPNYSLSDVELIHGMLLRKVLSSRNDEIWIKVNNTKLRFGLSEFAVINGLKCTDLSKEDMREDSPVNSQNELKLLRTDLNLSAEYHSGHNVEFKNDDTHVGNSIRVNLSDNVGRQTDGTPKADYVSDNVVDGVRQKNIGVENCIDTEAENKLSANLVDDVEKENIDVGDHIDVVTENHLSDNVIDNIGKETVGVGDRIDTDVADRPITGCTSVALEAPEVLVDVRSIRKNVDDTSVGDKSIVILGDTPVVLRRIRKPAAICESLYVFKFDFGCSNVQGQPTKCIDKRHSRKHIFNIKYPFTISITEPFLDMKLLSSFNKFVDKSLRFNSKDCGVFVAAFTEYMIESVQIPASLDHIDSIRADMMYYCGNMERQLL